MPQGALGGPATPAPAATVPDPPTAVTASVGDSSVALSWAVPDDDGGSALTGYVVQYSSDGGVTWTTDTADCTSTATSCTVTGLTNGTSYQFNLTATNAIGSSTPASSATAVTPMAIPGPPTNVTATAGAGSATVSWTAPGDDGGSALTGYVVQYSSDGGTTWTTDTADCTGTAPTCTVNGLTNGTSYLFQVAATNAVGTSTTAATATAVTPITVPDAPSGLSVVSSSGTAILNWTGVDNDGGSPVTGFEAQYSIDGGLTWTNVPTCDGVLDDCTITGLANGTTYVFQVAAINAVGAGAYSTSSDPTTPGAVPAPPTNVTAAAGDTTASISWTAPTDTGGRLLTGYVVEYSSDGGNTWTADTTDCSGTATTCIVTGLTNNTAYVFRVSAVTALGTSDPTGASAAVTPRSATSFTCSPQEYFLSLGGQLYQGSPGTGWTTVGVPSGINYNALGFNPNDGFLYAIGNGRTSSLDHHLLRITVNGAVHDLGAISGIPARSNISGGDVDPTTGTMWVTDNTNSTSTLYEINLSTQVATAVPTNLTGPLGADVVITDGLLYVESGSKLAAFPMSGTSLGTPIIESVWNVQRGHLGAMWANTATGSLMFGNNQTGMVTQLSADQLMASTARGTWAGTMPVGNPVDGATCTSLSS
jgi:hypothetical protein